MAISNVRTYFRGVLNTLNYTEHKTGFDFTDLQSTLVDKSYHFTYNNVVGGPTNQQDQSTDLDVIVRVFLKGYNGIDLARDDAMDRGEIIVANACSVANRLNNTLDIKNMVFNRFTIDQRSVSNDNEIVIEMNFTASYIICLN